jgi:hypothetical protein
MAEGGLMEIQGSQGSASRPGKILWWFLLPLATVTVCAILVRSEAVQSDQAKLVTALAVWLAIMTALAITGAYAVIRLKHSVQADARKHGISLP